MVTDYVSVPLDGTNEENTYLLRNDDDDDDDDGIVNNTLSITFCIVAKPKRTLTVANTLIVRELKALAFPAEVAACKRVRFIHHGRVLDDNTKLIDTALKTSPFVHVAITDSLPESVLSRRASSSIVSNIDDEDQEASDLRFARMLAEREGGVPGLNDGDEVVLDPNEGEQSEGDAGDFFWGCLLASLFGYIVIIFLWQPRVSRRLRLGILCGLMIFLVNGYSQQPSSHDIS